MLLRDIPFEPVSNASGGRNFFGEAYWFHGAWGAATAPARLLGRRIGLSYEGANFVAKTTTLKERPGNMPLRPNSTQPRELLKPRCIVVKFGHNAVLNKVGLSGWGLEWLLNQGLWQQRTQPFFLSYMTTGKETVDKLSDAEDFGRALAPRLSAFRTRIALEVNFSCPNVHHGGGDQDELLTEVLNTLDVLSALLRDVPLVPKFSVELNPALAVKIAQHPACDALVVSNTVPWGMYPHRIDWHGIFGVHESPLKDLSGPGGGGLSGAPVFPLMCDWLHRARYAGVKKPIIACGGILSPEDVRTVKDAGASAIEVGSASILCPWRVQGIIDEARRRFR